MEEEDFRTLYAFIMSLCRNEKRLFEVLLSREYESETLEDSDGLFASMCWPKTEELRTRAMSWSAYDFEGLLLVLLDMAMPVQRRQVFQHADVKNFSFENDTGEYVLNVNSCNEKNAHFVASARPMRRSVPFPASLTMFMNFWISIARNQLVNYPLKRTTAKKGTGGSVQAVSPLFVS